MTKLFVNGNLEKDNFLKGEEYDFEDFMGGSTNVYELKDGEDVIDRQEFTLKTPPARWFLWYAKVDGEDITMEVGTEFVNSNETTLKFSKNIDGAQVMFARAKYAAPEGTGIPIEKIESFNEYFAKDGKPTDKLVVLDKGVELFFDDTPSILNPTISTKGAPMLQVDFASESMINKNPGAGAAIGATKKIIIKNVSTEDISTSKDFTINLEWS
ncbi:hypothetical protein [Companilactobacillus metriopterae]|uniref:hypothetical protein n=1 Tax=Companilactobacillus metriopterae TaxID=1909267 RepID=UPI00100B4984|nr:hypothetical protein [Companilactobacillus metriopterae]